MALEFEHPTAAPVGEEAIAKRPSNRMTLRRRVSAKDRRFFVEQLSLLLSTGTALHPALQSITRQLEGSPMQSVAEDMADGVMQGRSLSEEMRAHPQAFSPLYINMIAASERGGFLPDVLDQLKAIEEKNDELKNSLISAFSYPAFLLAFSIFTLGFVLVGVFPKFADLFASIGDRLPGTTKVLIVVSDFLIAHWLWVAIGIIVAAGVTYLYVKSPGGRANIDRAKLSLPGLKHLWQRVYLVLMLRVIGTSIHHGVSLVDAVHTSRDVVNNGHVRHFLKELGDVLRDGGRLSHGLTHANWIPALAKQMLTTADESGAISPVMLRLSDYYGQELDRALKQFSRMVEPVMLVVMGLLVGVLVSAMILPIFKLSSSMG